MKIKFKFSRIAPPPNKLCIMLIIDCRRLFRQIYLIHEAQSLDVLIEKIYIFECKVKNMPFFTCGKKVGLFQVNLRIGGILLWGTNPLKQYGIYFVERWVAEM